MRGIFFHITNIFVLTFLVVFFCVSMLAVYVALTRPAFVIGLLETIVPTPTPQAPVRMQGLGVIGDSQSDEYRGDDNRGYNYPGTTKSWVELLSEQRNLNVGEWGTYAEPRRTGYAYNWARTGADSHSMVESGQHTGLAGQVERSEINVVVIFIGANDFAPFNGKVTGYEGHYQDTLTDAQKRSQRNRIVADITTAVDTLQVAGDVRIILVLIPDWGRHLGMRTAFPFPDQRRLVTDAIDATNRELRDLARRQHLAVLDPNAFFDNLPKDERGTRVQVGDVALEQLLLTNDPRNMYLDDGLHMGTVLNGLFANEVIKILNTQIANKIRPFSDEEILRAAGIVPD